MMPEGRKGSSRYKSRGDIYYRYVSAMKLHNNEIYNLGIIAL